MMRSIELSSQRIISGYIDQNGLVAYTPTPNEFTVYKSGTGVYIIYFIPEFRYRPTVVANIHNGQYFIATTTLEASRAHIVTATTSGGAGVDYPFLFHAIGVRKNS